MFKRTIQILAWKMNWYSLSSKYTYTSYRFVLQIWGASHTQQAGPDSQCGEINRQLINCGLVISDVFKMERKSSTQTSLDFFNSKITEAILKEITNHFIIRTYFLIKIWNLYDNLRQHVRKRHYLVDTVPKSSNFWQIW